MVNEDILTALKNSVENGEDLKTAMQILINSGYNAREVQETSKFVGSRVLTHHETLPEEQLTMPEKKKGLFSKLAFWKKSKSSKLPPLEQKYSKQESKQIKQAIQSDELKIPKAPKLASKGSLTADLKKIKPKKSYVKEIVLLMILLVLIGALIMSFVFRETIMSWFA
jgi:hypothetical protein